MGVERFHLLNQAKGTHERSCTSATRLGAFGTPEGDIDVVKDGQPQYELELRERPLADFVPTCWWQQTSPRSHFTRSIICSRLTGDGRVSISGRRLIRTVAGQRFEENLPGDQAVLAAYRDHFGIDLDRVPRLAACHDFVS